MRTIKVHYDNGDYIVTQINGTIPEIVRWYNLGTSRVVSEDFETGKEYRAAARSIEFLDHNRRRNRQGRIEELKRIYSISEEYKNRYGLISKFRYTHKEYNEIYL